MRLMILVHNLTGGGAERVASLWATGFCDRGYDVGIVFDCRHDTPITYPIPDQVKRYNVYGNRVTGWVANKFLRIFHVDLYYVIKLRHIFRDYKPDVVIGVIQPWAEWARKAAKGMNIKIVNTEHNAFERPSDALYNPMTRQLYREKYEQNRLYDHVTVLTEADRRCVDGVLDNVSVLPNPLTYKPVTEVPAKENVILAAGRLEAWHAKGLDVLIKAWGLVADRYPDWTLQIAGDVKGNGYITLERIAADAGVGDRIEFTGYQSDMLPVYQRSAIFVMASRYEGFGMVLIEAMSQGCACVACDYKGRQKEIITTDDEGLICSPDDAQSLAHAISMLIDDRDYRKRVQINGIERAIHYELDRIMDLWDDVLKKVCYESA